MPRSPPPSEAQAGGAGGGRAPSAPRPPRSASCARTGVARARRGGRQDPGRGAPRRRRARRARRARGGRPAPRDDPPAQPRRRQAWRERAGRRRPRAAGPRARGPRRRPPDPSRRRGRPGGRAQQPRVGLLGGLGRWAAPAGSSRSADGPAASRSRPRARGWSCRPTTSRSCPSRSAARRRATSRPRSSRRRAAAARLTALDLHGERVEAALERLNAHLDDALLAGLDEVVIVHGIGTGALRRAVREALREHPRVRGFRGGRKDEGGDGATVAEL